MSDRIENVSDTALWVATLRAREGQRPDALYRDPLVAVLAGERGEAIARSMKMSRVMAWAMLLRTTAIDRLIREGLKQGIDTVWNLGAGLDTRPYRMELPAKLRWVEVDFPHMIQLKDERLRGERPVCQLERIALDWFGFFAAHGWRLREKIWAIDEAVQIRRRPPFIFPWSLLWMVMPPGARAKLRQSMGYLMWEKGPVPVIANPRSG